MMGAKWVNERHTKAAWEWGWVIGRSGFRHRESRVVNSETGRRVTGLLNGELGQGREELVEAFEKFKLLILRYRAESWQDCGPSDVTNILMALQELVLSDSDAATP